MVRAVLDANVIVSGIASLEYGTTAPPAILSRWGAQEFGLAISSPIFVEVRNALRKPYFQRRRTSDVAERLIESLEQGADVVTLNDAVVGVASHRHDDRVLETALEGRADYLVTGDKELLALEHPFDFQIIHPNAFLAILEGDEAEE